MCCVIRIVYHIFYYNHIFYINSFSETFSCGSSGAGALGEGKMLLQGPLGDGSGSSFTPLVVVELASDTKEEAIAWLLSRIRDQQRNGGVEVRVYLLHCNIGFHCLPLHSVLLILLLPPGAELLVEQLGPGVGPQEKENPNLFLVGATWQRLLSGAEDVGLFKEFNDGSMRGFTFADRHNFQDFKGKVQEEAA